MAETNYRKLWATETVLFLSILIDMALDDPTLNDNKRFQALVGLANANRRLLTSDDMELAKRGMSDLAKYARYVAPSN